MNNIRKLRSKLHMTQSDFAEHCDVSIISISRYEAGENISRRNAEKIAHACHVSIDYVLNQPVDPSVHDEEQETSGVILSAEETNLIENYRRMSQRGKFHIRKIMKELIVLYPLSNNT